MLPYLSSRQKFDIAETAKLIMDRVLRMEIRDKREKS